MKTTITILMIPITIVICGVALQDLWGWFVVPLGVSAITFWHALGFSTLISALTAQADSASLEAPETARWIVNTIFPPLKWLFAWGLGALWSLGMP